ncbi:hypothetical protein NLX83_32980 [Allokutzneria sp. A3M-2-11 16]|uniref:hypothetical protein n=1 Tax=Allokutzneria sp. A3M-2-11 16 TaxID=2962043 RepID=UPI0020B65EF1|nr:hypothetical protein [Allokutzneria sp. A3M-2-11 16]MCP3804097.1 hypothetical protein [Allokutzneria sp. A3M-2-11 16]
MGYRKGDSVVAKKDLGGVLSKSVPRGSSGVVTETFLGRPTRVAFRVGNQTVERSVNDREAG